MLNKLFYILIIISTMLNTSVVYSNNENTCAEENQLEMKRHNQRVLDDILSSFKIDLNGYNELPSWESIKKFRLERTLIEARSFESLFIGSSIGERRLFIKSGDNKVIGYLLYKKINGTNVVQTVVKENGVWKVVDTKKKQAKRFYANFKKCDEDSK